MTPRRNPQVAEWIAECEDRAPIETAVEIAAEAAAALDVANQAEQTAACARERLLEFAEVGFEADGLKVIERTIESIPPEEIAALRERLRAEGRLERRTIRAVIRTGEG
jgi:hypothetical protein